MSFPATPKDASGIPIGCIYVPNVGFVALQGISVTTDGSGNASAAVVFSLTVGTALPPWGSNPAQTAAAGADTLYKFGAGGTTSGNHCAIQNNGTINVLYAFDQSTTSATNQVYVLAPGQLAAWDRAFIVLHFSSAAQVAFGGSTGITVEAFV